MLACFAMFRVESMSSGVVLLRHAKYSGLHPGCDFPRGVEEGVVIENKVKLVIWDLDETFWRGTLAEEGMTPIDGNAEKVIELSKRGIINSICSKNDYERARGKLMELGVWEYFVFPSISFNPKGQAIAQMIEEAALRPENVLFVDDNPSNLEEVKFFNPGIMAAHPDDVLSGLLDHPHCAGKPDPELTRLKQYQFLQKKVEERSTTSLSNEEFLRASNIRVAIDYDIESNFDRVVELINRTNQLNYTKKRLEEPKDLRRFRRLLRTYGYNYGCVWVSDNYGDYGLVGFFMMMRRVGVKKLIHFVFSCRTMNMGIEQYVYEMLDKPDVVIAEPVSYGLEAHAKIDWINTGGETSAEMGADRSGKLLLLGGCDLLQLASYCSTNRTEFVNIVRGGVPVRYDDLGFLLSDRKAMAERRDILPTWSYDDAVKFDAALADADLVLLCMYGAVNGTYYELDGSLRLRISPDLMESWVENDPYGLQDRVRELDIEPAERAELTLAFFDDVAKKAKSDAKIFVVGYSSLATPNPKKAAKRKAFNGAQAQYCERNPRFRFMDVDTLLPREEIVTERHFSPAGYFALAREILTQAGMSGPATLTRDARAKAPAESAVAADAVS